MPAGLFGSRADLLVDLSLILFIVLPVLVSGAIRLARAQQYRRHRDAQSALLVVMTLAVGLLEADIRLQGGTGALAAHAAHASATGARVLLLVHIAIAALTWSLWVYLVVRSRRGFRADLPGTFGPTHKRLGQRVVLGLVATAGTGTVLYILAYVL